jgi:hypothetical protein
MQKNTKQLPHFTGNAISVPNYAKLHGHTTQYIYNMIQKGKANFKIVVYQGFNFVIPL